MMVLRGEYHNAKKCTIDGRDCWVAALVDLQGHLPLSVLKYDCIEEFTTKAAAVTWLTRELIRRNMPVTVEERK